MLTSRSYDWRIIVLTVDDIRHFAEEGYLVVRDVVPEPLLVAADAEIDELIQGVDPHEGNRGPGQNSWFQPIPRLPGCEEALRRSAALTIARQLVEPLGLDHAFPEGIQVATTVPPWSHVPGGPHLDGFGPNQDPPATFTMLVAVLLSDQRGAQSGNLWVWPGSHVDHQRLFQERGTRVLHQTGGHATLLEPPLVLGEGVPVQGGRGDLLLAHYLLGHNKGGNLAHHERRSIYYRLAVPGHSDRWEETLLDPWFEYEPVQRVLRESVDPPSRLG